MDPHNMSKKTYPRSVAKFIRRKKASIRRQVQDPLEQKRRIDEFLNQVKDSKK